MIYIYITYHSHHISSTVYGIHKNITYGLYSPSGLICKFMTNHDEPSEVGGRTVEEANDFWNCSNSKKNRVGKPNIFFDI